MPTFKIWRIGTREACIEEAETVRQACAKAGWKPEECEVQIIPEENIIHERYGRGKHSASPMGA
jgi:hypothetical protein